MNEKSFRKNEQINAPEVRVIAKNGELLGVMETQKALQMAFDQEQDLVEIAPNQVPPVCKIIDYGAFLYRESKKRHDAERHSAESELKEIRLRPVTDEGDLQTKVRHIADFLKKGHRVKVVVKYKGREIAHPEFGRKIFDKITEEISEFGKLETPARMEGRHMIGQFVAHKKQQGKPSKPAGSTQPAQGAPKGPGV